MKTTMRNLFVKFWLAMTILAYSPLARGQTALQPVYGRPAKSPVVQLLDNAAMKTCGSDSDCTYTSVSGSTTTNACVGGYCRYISSVIDMTGFEGAYITVTLSDDDCSQVPDIYAMGRLSTGISTNFPVSDRTSQFTFPQTASGTENVSYPIKTASKYLLLQVDSLEQGGADSCTVDVWFTQMPYFSGASSTSAWSLPYGVKSVTTSVTKVGEFQRYTTSLTLQNNSTAVVYCGLDRFVSTSHFAFTLKAGTAANDGTGGSATLENVMPPVFCRTSSGTADVSWFAN